METRRNRINSLQGLRCLACLTIVASHCAWGGGGPDSVSIFFILSGFLTYYNYCDADIESGIVFAINHLKKFYGLHLLMLVMAFIFEFREIIDSRGLIENCAHALAHIFLVQSWIPIKTFFYSMNRVAWYLSTAWLAWLCFPNIKQKLSGVNKRSTAVLYIVFVLSIMFGSALLMGEMLKDIITIPDWLEWFTYIFPIYRLGDFVVGCLLARIYLQRETSVDVREGVKWSIYEGIGVLSTAIVGYMYYKKVGFIGNIEWIRYNLIYILPNSLLVYTIAINKGIISKVISNKLFIKIGNISVYVFLFHQLIIRFLNRDVLPHIINNGMIKINPISKFLIVCGITFTITICYCRFMNTIKGRIKKNVF